MFIYFIYLYLCLEAFKHITTCFQQLYLLKVVNKSQHFGCYFSAFPANPAHTHTNIDDKHLFCIFVTQHILIFHKGNQSKAKMQ